MAGENELGTSGGGDTGGFDMEAGLAEMSDGLFPDAETPEDDGDLDFVDKTIDAAPKTPVEPAKPAEPDPTKPPADPTKPEGTPPAPGPNDPPKSWTDENKAKFASLDPAIQAQIQKREDDFHKGIEGYKEAANFGRAVHTVIKPYENILRHFQIDPIQQVSDLMKAHHTLAMGSAEDKMAMFRSLAADYGVDLAAIGEEPYEDPAAKALRMENARLKSEKAQRETEGRAQQEATLKRQIDAFEADPKNVYFKEVIGEMIPFLHAGDSLEAAYAKAVGANPATRAKEFARQSAEAEAKRKADEEARVAAAKKATSANVRSSAKSGSATAPLGSIEDTMRDTLASIKARPE